MIRFMITSDLESVGDTWVNENSPESLARCVYFGDGNSSSACMQVVIVKRYLEEAAGDSRVLDHGGIARTPVKGGAAVSLRVCQRNGPDIEYHGGLTLVSRCSPLLAMTVAAANAAVNVVSRKRCMLWV